VALLDALHESTPQPRGKNTVKRNSKRKISRKFGETETSSFSGSKFVGKREKSGKERERKVERESERERCCCCT